MFTGMSINQEPRKIVIYVQEKHWKAFEESEEFEAMKKLIAKLKGCDQEKQDEPVTRKDLSGYATWNEVLSQIRCVDSRIDRWGWLLAAVTAVAVAALALAIHAVA